MNPYELPVAATSGEQPGTRLFRERVSMLFGVPNLGGYNPRCTSFHPVKPGASHCPLGHRISHHAEGRAWDAMTFDRDLHQAIWQWCLGAEGQAWGVQEIITGYGPAGKPQRCANDVWLTYTGASKHLDHVHISLTTKGAAAILPPAPTEPPPDPTPLGDDDMYTLWRVVGYSDIGITGPGVAGHVPSMEVYSELVRAGVVKVAPTGENWHWTTPATYEFMTGERLTAPT